MGCLLGCFSSSKDHSRRRQRKRVTPQAQKNGGQNHMQSNVSTKLGITGKATNLVPELGEKSDEQLSLSTRNRVTFDPNVKTYEHVSVYESTDALLENNTPSEGERKNELVKSRQSYTNSEDNSLSSSVGSYPSNHRYQNCQYSDDEVEEHEYEYEDTDLDDEEDGYGEYDDDGDESTVSLVCQEVWSDSIPTASMDSNAKVSLTRVASEEVESVMTICGLRDQEVKTIGLNRNARDRSAYVHAVLNPVENITQWKAVKSKETMFLKRQQKENFDADSFSSELSSRKVSFSFEQQQSHQAKIPNQEIAVDASLSNWLVTKKATPNTGLETIITKKSMSRGSTSVMSMEDRPILGTLTLEELKQFSSSSSPLGSHQVEALTRCQ